MDIPPSQSPSQSPPPPPRPPLTLPPQQWLPPSSSEEEEEEEEEEEDRPHHYNQGKYEAVVKLINKEPTLTFDHLARRVVSVARSSKGPLNLIGDSVLHEVIARRKTHLAVAIIRLPYDFNDSILRHRNYYGDTPLHIAAVKGNSTVAKALLERVRRLGHKRNRKGETPLHKAVQSGHLDVFNIIIEVGGRDLAHYRTDDGSTILHYAIMHDQTLEALDIAGRFPELILTRNVRGASPLQIMMAFYKKPRPKTGILISLLYQCLTLDKDTRIEEWIIDEERGTILPNKGNWWPSLPDIRNLQKKVVKAREMSNYEMNMALLKLLVPNDLAFYFGGFTSEKYSINRSARDTIRNISSNTADQLDEVDADDSIRWEESPLITGIKLGIDDFVIKLLQVSPWSANYVDNKGRNVLQAAVKYGRRLVVKAIKKDERLPPWLFTALESGTNNTLLHIAASYKNHKKEADPLCLQDELEWFEMLEKIVPEELLNYRNEKGKTAREVFDEEHVGMLKNCRSHLAEIGRTCSPLVAAVVFTSSFYIPGDHNRESNRLAFKIFSHVYVVGFSCAATSLVMFLLLVVMPFTQRNFRRKVPWHYLMACFLLAMSLAAFIVAFACNMYLQIYGGQRNTQADLATMLLELLLVPFLCAWALSLTGASWIFSILKRLTK